MGAGGNAGSLCAQRADQPVPAGMGRIDVLLGGDGPRRPETYGISYGYHYCAIVLIPSHSQEIPLLRHSSNTTT